MSVNDLFRDLEVLNEFARRVQVPTNAQLEANAEVAAATAIVLAQTVQALTATVATAAQVVAALTARVEALEAAGGDEQ